MADPEHRQYPQPGPALPPRPAKPEGLQDVVNSWWLLELFAWVTSAVALVVLIVTLFLADDRPLPHWPMRITLNSFVSILGTIMKAAMVVPIAEGISQLKWLWFKKAGVLKDIQTFDEASRGMWGSLKLLLSTKGVHLAKLGAFLSVFSLAMDPFIQQVITYPSRLVLSGVNSTAPVATAYNDYSWGQIMALKSPSLSFKSAVSTGLFNMHDDPLRDFDITPYCPTGNCTWSEPYRSLAVCSKCANITESLTKKCNDETIESLKKCTYSLPSNFSMTNTYPMTYINVTGRDDSINFNGTQATMTTVTAIRSLHDLSGQTMTGATAQECVLYWCVQEFAGNVSAGTFTEKVVSTYSNSTNLGFMVTENTTIVPPGSDTLYEVGFVARNAINNYFGSLWEGNVTGSVGETSASNDLVEALYTLGDSGVGDGTPKPEGMNTTMQAVAKSITKLLRTQQNGAGSVGSVTGSTSTAKGEAWQTETYVHVRWWWLAFPAGMLALTLIFLLGTILSSAASGVAVWKSSTLALLQIRLVDEDNQHGGDAGQGLRDWGTGKLTELNQWANRSELRLHRSETGAEFHLNRKM
ncbi:hypothetical protein B0J12DRAFT_582831 [Macrophomina phaseolina]|uniref:Uncharacterized protein n=1 Tax=Macrophomina phaseolina TaxID=35725 RepID=A0ABQ8FX60_9PEZI|nr:hypothetical protein B0J12DRAFT_582831 [Macrophomina phaseolina]